jgi:CRISPR-associated protein Csa3
VEKIVCNNIEDEEKMELVELPKFSFGLTRPKKGLLLELLRREGRSIAEIASKLKKSRGIIYQHLKNLKEMGYVDEKFEITLAGRLALI